MFSWIQIYEELATKVAGMDEEQDFGSVVQWLELFVYRNSLHCNAYTYQRLSGSRKSVHGWLIGISHLK